MRQVEHEFMQLWVGSHPKLGVVIYDVNSQRDLPEAEVRLYKIADRSAGRFIKSVIKLKLVALDDKAWSQAQPAIDEYINMITNRRVTHCFRCKAHLDSVDFSVCPKCRWIKCQCESCGCSYQGNLGAEA